MCIFTDKLRLHAFPYSQSNLKLVLNYLFIMVFVKGIANTITHLSLSVNYEGGGGGGAALGSIRNHESIEKIIQNRKTAKNSIKTGNRIQNR